MDSILDIFYADDVVAMKNTKTCIPSVLALAAVRQIETYPSCVPQC